MHKTIPDLTDLAKSIKPGIYRHFSGPEYELVGVAFEEATMEEMVVYKSLKDQTLWIRSVSNFLEDVERDDYIGPRFSRVI